jgi:hypothetical protein
MPAKELGVSITPRSTMPNKKEKSFTKSGLKLSDRARSAIEEIEANARTAEQMIGSLTLK